MDLASSILLRPPTRWASEGTSNGAIERYIGRVMENPPALVEMMTIVAPRGAPSLEEAARQLGIDPNDMDASFGVVPIDPQRGLYAVQIRSKKPQQPASGQYQGPWSNPRIEPFGPVQGAKDNK